MVLTMKLSSFAYNLYDGTADYKRVFPDTPYTDKKSVKLYGDRQRFAITSLPNPIEFFGYVYCFTCILAGPAFEYNDYIRSINGSIFQRSQIPSKVSNKEPSPVLQPLLSLFIGIFCLAVYLMLGSRYSLSKLYNEEFIASTNVFYRMLYTYLALIGERFKYYFIWKMAEGASVLGGFGFEGFDEEGKAKGWEGVSNISIIEFETAPNVQTLTRVWNKRTQGWLERYTYLRYNRNLVITYFVSALWHGLYPGYFIFFASLAIFTEIERLVRIKLNPYIVPEYDGYNMKTYPRSVVGYLYWAINVCMTTVSLNFIAQVFPLRFWGRCHVALMGYYYTPYGLFGLVYVVLKSLRSKKKKE
jgi:MBOAT, membrane-bound O-acyltransferase family